MSWERRLNRKLDELEATGFTEFREGETVKEWIRRMNAELPDPWATVKRFNRKCQERKLQAWVDAHLIRRAGGK